MFIPFAAPALAAFLLIADGPPTFNVEPNCRAAAERAKPTGDVQVCLRKELDARDAIARDWMEFKAADKAQCVSLSTRGGKPTYTELLTCLEMAKQARALRDKEEGGTTGSAVSGADDRPGYDAMGAGRRRDRRW